MTPEEKFLREYRTISKEALESIFKKKNIESAKVEVFQAFTLELINKVYDTFLGNDMINNEQDIKAHFGWCYQKASSQFVKKQYKFHENVWLKEYFLAYFLEHIYLAQESKENDLDHFSFILDHEKPKERFALDSFLELYKIFDATERSGRILLKR